MVICGHITQSACKVTYSSHYTSINSRQTNIKQNKVYALWRKLIASPKLEQNIYRWNTSPLLQQCSEWYGKGSHCNGTSRVKDQPAHCWHQKSQRLQPCTREAGAVWPTVAVGCGHCRWVMSASVASASQSCVCLSFPTAGFKWQHLLPCQQLMRSCLYMALNTNVSAMCKC